MTDITKIALGWLEQSIAPIPCHYKSKRPRVAWEKYQDTLPTQQQVLAWFAGEHTNLAIVCGWSGLVVIDFDSMDAYELWLEYHSRTTEHKFLPDSTLRVITGRGVHLYLMVDEPVSTSHVAGLVDIKANGYVLTDPSLHPSGRCYQSNHLPILRVPTLHGLVPDEWLQCDRLDRSYVAPEPVSDDPLSNLDRAGESLVQSVLRMWRVTDFIQGTPTRDGWQIAKCPFHSDHAPSFWIDTKRQLCGCFRGCNSKPLDVINLYARLNGLSNQEAIMALAQRR